MKGAIVFGYGRPHPGRESPAYDVFRDALTYFGKLAADESVDEPLALAGMAGNGLMIIPGEREKLIEIIAREEFLRLVFRAGLVAPDIKYELMTFGEDVEHFMDLWFDVAKELSFA